MPYMGYETIQTRRLPLGTGGKALLMLSGHDSPVAGIDIMRRGVEIEAVHFSIPPGLSKK